MLTKATVVGTGAMATVCAQILASNDVHVALLANRAERVQELLVARENQRYLPGVRLLDRIVPTADAARAFGSTELIISALPCQFLREAWRRFGSHAPADVPICSATKGLEVGTLARPSQIIAEHVRGNPVCVLSGPCIAPEVARCLPTTVVLACSEGSQAQQLQGVLTTSWFRVYTSKDVLGVELAGAVKNVVALAAGILDGLRAGDNAKAALVTRGLVEITRLGVAMGANAETFVGLAGIGDLVTTCISPVGRNRSAGERIGRNVPIEQVVRQSDSVIEGVPTTKAVVKLATRLRVEMPITLAVHDVLFAGKPPLEAITELMNRPPKAEARQ